MLRVLLRANLKVIGGKVIPIRMKNLPEIGVVADSLVLKVSNVMTQWYGTPGHCKSI